MLAITATGVDLVLNGGGPVRRGVQLLDSGEEPANAAREQAEGGTTKEGRSLSRCPRYLRSIQEKALAGVSAYGTASLPQLEVEIHRRIEVCRLRVRPSQFLQM